MAIRGGKARDISAPSGRRIRVRSGAVIEVGNEYFRHANVSVAQGARLRWLFPSPALHNVTVANGPLGFSSRNLSSGREFTAKLTRPGTYRIFCALHPVSMTATIKVTRRKKHK